MNNTITVEYVLTLLDGVKSGGGKKWQALCPAHNDTTPSLSIGVGNDGKILLHCQAGCSFAEICMALGIESSELFPKTSNNTGHGDPPIAVFNYQNAEGIVVGRKCKYAKGHKPPHYWQRPDGSGRWITKLEGRKMPLFNLPALIQADKNELVFFPEGEKDVNTLINLGLVAVTNPHGCGEKWKATYNKHLRNRKIVILPDNDEAGIKHAKKVAAGILKIAAEVKIVQLDRLPVKGDVSDWMETGGDVSQLMVRVNLVKPMSKDELLPEKTVTGTFALSQAGNAERFAYHHAKLMRFCYGWKQWFFFDAVSWNAQMGDHQATALGIETARRIIREADEVDYDTRQLIGKWSLKSESCSDIKAMLELAKAQETIACYPETFDQDRMFFNTKSKTLNFKEIK